MTISPVAEPLVSPQRLAPPEYLDTVLNRVNLEDCLALMERLPSG